jgi:hypothetical protein
MGQVSRLILIPEYLPNPRHPRSIKSIPELTTKGGAIMKRLMLVIVFVTLSVCLAGTSAFAAREDIVAAWLFEGIEGNTVKDATGNGHDGEIVGDPKIAEGKFGKGLEFDGVDDYVEVPHSDDLNFETFTLAAWIKMGNTGANQNVIVKKIPSPERKTYQLISHTGSAGAMRGSFHVDGANRVVMGIIPVTDEEWHHTATTYDGSTLKVYLDGELESEVAADGTPDTSDAPLGLGSSCPGQFMKGIIDEAFVVSVALEQEEIKEIMTNGLMESLSVQFRGKLAATWGAIKMPR